MNLITPYKRLSGFAAAILTAGAIIASLFFASQAPPGDGQLRGAPALSASTPRQTPPACCAESRLVAGRAADSRVTAKLGSTEPEALVPLAAEGVRIIAAFQAWGERYANAAPSERAALVTEGVALALARHPWMVQLIESDPREALRVADAFSPQARAELPPEVSAYVERMVSGKGDLEVVGVLRQPGEPGAPYLRTATIGEEQFTAYTYGKRFEPIPEQNAPLLGVALVKQATVQTGDETVARPASILALREEKFHILNAPELAVARLSAAGVLNSVCPISGLATQEKESETAVDTGGEITVLCDPAHAAQVAAEATSGPIANLGAPGEQVGSFRNIPVGWTTGSKRTLVLVARCSDRPESDFDFAQIGTTISLSAQRFAEWSYGKLQMSYTVPSTVLALPQTEAWYLDNGGANRMRSDAIALVKASDLAGTTNYQPDSANFICFIHNLPNSSVGSATVVGRMSNVRLAVPSVVNHEQGHNLGLPHANVWVPSTADPIGPGSHAEYYDPYCAMGFGDNVPFVFPFNVTMRYHLSWLDEATVPLINASRTAGTQTFDLYDLDTNTLTPGRVYGLRIPKPDGNYYFLEFRPQPDAQAGPEAPATHPSMSTGVRILRTDGSELLDCTPGTPELRDAALQLSQSFRDQSFGLTITPTVVGSSGNAQYITVAVTFTNTAPVANSQSISTAEGFAKPITLVATDADLDVLTYSIVSSPAHGSLSGTAPNITYTPAANYTGADSFTFMANDGTVDSVVATVSITVNATTPIDPTTLFQADFNGTTVSNVGSGVFLAEITKANLDAGTSVGNWTVNTAQGAPGSSRAFKSIQGVGAANVTNKALRFGVSLLGSGASPILTANLSSQATFAAGEINVGFDYANATGDTGGRTFFLRGVGADNLTVFELAFKSDVGHTRLAYRNSTGTINLLGTDADLLNSTGSGDNTLGDYDDTILKHIDVVIGSSTFDVFLAGTLLGNDLPFKSAGATGLNRLEFISSTQWTGGWFDNMSVTASGVGASPYDTWSGGAAYNADANNDGVANGIAWVLGALNPNDVASRFLPTVDTTSDPNGKMLFVFRRSTDASSAANTSIAVEYSSSLSGWIEASHQGTGASQITISEQANGFGAGIDKVTVAIPRSLTAAGKLFARLKAVLVTP